MALFEIINMSDPYSLKTDDWKSACIATMLLGGGAYGLEEYKGERVMPIFLFGGADAWVQEHFGCSVDKFVEDMDRPAVIAALDSVLIGSPGERAEFEDILEAIDDPEKKKAIIEKRHDRKRSSMNDIGGRAEALAERLREPDKQRDPKRKHQKK